MSAYGAAGSLIALLLWIYYSAQIFFFGAVFTRQFALRFGKAAKADDTDAADAANKADAASPTPPGQA